MSDNLDERITNAKKLIKDVSEILREVSDDEVAKILGDGCLDFFYVLFFILKENLEIYEYLLENKNRGTLIALLRHAIAQNYSINGTVDGTPVFVSPSHMQWYDDGVMFTQGKERFGGLIGLYQMVKLNLLFQLEMLRKEKIWGQMTLFLYQ